MIPSTCNTTLSELLRAETRSCHVALEKTMMAFLRAIRQTADYHLLLSLMHGFIRPTEERVFKFITKEMMPDVADRRNSEALLKDIGQPKGHSFHPYTTQIPKIENAATALGAMYVLEGSTLGGVHVAKMVEKILGNTVSYHYFNCYGDHTKYMWMKFQETMEHTRWRPHQAAIVHTARETFSLFDTWLTAHKKSALQ